MKTKHFKDVEKSVLKRIKDACNFKEEENKNYLEAIESYYNCAKNKDDSAENSAKNKTDLSFNQLPSIVNPCAKQISDADPTTKVKPINDQDPQKQVDADEINNKLDKMFDANKYSVQITSATIKALVAGKAVFKQETDYLTSKGFEQHLIIEEVKRPELVIFDNAAIKPSRSDARFVVEKVILKEDDALVKLKDCGVDEDFLNKIKNSDGQLMYSFGSDEDKSFIVYDYYYYKNDSQLLIQYDDGQNSCIAENELKKQGGEFNLKDNTIVVQDEQGEFYEYKIIQTRNIHSKRVSRNRILGDKIIEESKLNFDSIPFFQFTAKQYIDKDGKAIIKPQIDDAIDAQRAKNMMANELLTETLDLYKQTVAVGKSQLTPELIEFAKNPSSKSVLIFDDKTTLTDSMGKKEIMLPPPQFTQKTNTPPEYLQFFTVFGENIDKIMATYQMQIAERDMSGKALYNLAQMVSGMLTPFVFNLLDMLEAITLSAISSFKYIYQTEKSDFDYEKDEFEVYIDVGVNNKLQQEANITQMVDLAESSPNSVFAQFLSSPKGVMLLLENMDLKNKEKTIEEFKAFLENQPKPQPSPTDEAALTNARANMTKAQTDKEYKEGKLEIEAQIASAQSEKNNQDTLLSVHQQKSDNQKTALEARAQMEKAQAENFRTIAERG